MEHDQFAFPRSQQADNVTSTSAWATELPRRPPISLPEIYRYHSLSPSRRATPHTPAEYLPLLRAYSVDLPSLLCGPTEDWNYDSRYAAQELLPYLLLGPSSVAKNVDFLTTERVTLVLCLREWSPAATLHGGGALAAAARLGIETHFIDVPNPASLIATFPVVIRQINAHVARPAFPLTSRVLLCCVSGNRLSAAAAVAYCMQVLGFNLMWAVNLIRTRRFCAALEDDLKVVLQAYEGIVAAQRDVAAAQADHDIGGCTGGVDDDGVGDHGWSVAVERGRSSKRRIAEVDQREWDDDDMTDTGAGRSAHAPFADCE